MGFRRGMPKSFDQTVTYDKNGSKGVFLTIDRIEDPHLVSKMPISQKNTALYGGKGLNYGFTLADEPLQWLIENCTNRFQIRGLGMARHLNVWFASETDATLFRMFFG